MSQKTIIIFAAAILLLGVKATSASAATYYVSNSGNDSNSGISEAVSWKTIHKVIYSSLKPGDSILFKRGDIWREQLEIPASGSAGNPIIFGAYGTGENPKIDGEGIRTYCVYMLNRSNITIQDFAVQNTTTPGTGVGIYANASNTISNITIQRVNSSFNGWDGFSVESNNPLTSASADNINIQNCTADQNGRAGFHVFGINGGPKGINFIHDKATYSGQKQPNHGFSSYVANNVHRYYCEAAYTGLVPGCLDINPENADSCKLPNADSEGIGFAFDDATNDSSNFACFSHDNAGTGFQAAHASSAGASNNNSTSYSISASNGKWGFVINSGGPAGVAGNDLFNNVVVNNGTLEVLGSGSGIEIWANSADPVSNVNIENNILINNFGYGIKGSFAGMSDIFVSDNLIFENTGGITAYIQEAKRTKTENPLFSNASSSYIYSSDFRLQPSSPAIDAGADVGLTSDFEGKPVPQGSAPDIGAFEYSSGTPSFSKSDINQDSLVNITDLGILMSDFGKSAASATNPRSDINTDGSVNVIDLGILMSEWE